MCVFFLVIFCGPEIVPWSCSHIVMTVGSYTGHVIEMASNLIDATLINLISQTGAGIPLDLV